MYFTVWTIKYEFGVDEDLSSVTGFNGSIYVRRKIDGPRVSWEPQHSVFPLPVVGSRTGHESYGNHNGYTTQYIRNEIVKLER